VTEPKIFQKRIGDIVAEDYRTSGVFEKYGIDFCCGGQEPLISTCQKRNLDFDVIQLEIEAVKKEPLARSEDYATWELSFLVDYIVNTHHVYLNKEMEPIASYAHKIADACNTFAVTYEKLKEFEDDLHHHVHLENNIFFLKAAHF